MKKYFENINTAIFISFIAMILWGSAIPMIKVSYEVFHISNFDYGAKILLAGYRFLGAGILVIFYKMMFERTPIAWSKANWKFLFLLSLVQITVQYIFYYIGLGNTDGVKAAVIQGLNSILIVLLAHFMFSDDKMNRKKAIALVMGMVAVILANVTKNINFSFHLKGEGFILIATVFNAWGTLMVRKYGQHQDTYLISIFQFLFGSIWLILLGHLTMKENLVLSWQGIFLILYGSFISGTAFLLWYMVLKYQKAGNIGIFKLFVPIFGSLLAAVFLHEKLTPNLFAALALTVGASLFLNSKWMEEKNYLE